MLGVTFTNHLSISEHISDIICRCAQSLYTIKVLRCHGMNKEELRLVFKTVVLAKILYATPAWWGFTSAADRQRIEAFVRRCVRLGLYQASDPTLTQLIADNDDNLFRNMLYNEHLPGVTKHQYHLRQRRHNHCLTVKTDDRNFVTRQLFIDTICIHVL